MWRDTANYPTRRDQGYPGGEEGCKSDKGSTTYKTYNQGCKDFII